MKGLKVKEALLGNAIDIYALLKEAVKEGIYPKDQTPNQRELEHYYLTGLLSEMRNPTHKYYIAQRGRGFLGYAHLVIMPDRWNRKELSILIETVFVVKKRRKMGIGKALIDEIKKLAQDNGIKNIVLLGKDDMLGYWEQQGAEKLSNYLRIEV